MLNGFLSEAENILYDESKLDESYSSQTRGIRLILEDAYSPITRKYQEKLYKSVLNKAHIDFGNIPASKGNIRNYSGTQTMLDTLNAISELANEEKATNVIEYVDIIKKTIQNLEDLHSTYELGFTSKTEYVAMEYNTYVYFCVEATTALLYSFIDVMKAPDKRMYEMHISNNKLRANEFYFIQLKKFNRVQDSMGINYRKMLESLCKSGQKNFIGAADAIGTSVIIATALAIIPITREIIYQIYHFRGSLSSNLEMQATFLELNKTCLENDPLMTEEKKKKVSMKQEKLIRMLHKISDVIKVKSAKSIMDSKRELEKENKMFSIDNIRDEVSNAPLEII